MFLSVMQKLRLALPGIVLLVAACSINPPVQEMSNARQTIQSAYEAKAQLYAAQPLKEAERLLEQATTALDAGDYPSAREYAIAAQHQAIKARQQAIAKSRPE
jgi:predicted S18 family serine protease